MNDLLNNEPVKRVQAALNKFNVDINIKILENTARTAKDAAKALNCEVGAIVKSLIFRKNDLFFLCLVSGDKRCSLNKLKKFPKQTQIYCGHEYTKKNLDFCLNFDPKNNKLKEKMLLINKHIQNGTPTVPTLLEDELECNIFLRSDNSEIQKQIDKLNKNY